MKTTLRTTILVALVAGLLSPASSLAASRGCASQWVDLYDVSATAERKVYRLGDTAQVAVKVTDAITGAPAQDVDVAAGALVDESYYVYGTSRTNKAGVAKLKLRLSRKHMTPGWAELRALARTYYDEGDAACAGLGIYGYERAKRAFRITR